MEGIVALHPALAAARTLRVVIAGHVDHGKSTLIGRLLHDTGTLGPERVTAVEAMSKKRGMPFEWSFLIDALQSERDQGITIDTAEVQFRTARRRYVLIDAPGHAEFLKNMVSGAAGADAALLLVDAREGTLEQSRRHALILGLLGITQVVVAINKMDLVDYDQARYQAVTDEISAYLNSVGIIPWVVVPLAARHGENIVTRSGLMPWYEGPSLVEALDGLEAAPAPTDRPLRLPVQDVYKFDDRRIVAGRIESGTLKVGQTLRFAPSGKVARIATIENWPAAADQTIAKAGEAVGLTLDPPIFVERGQIATLAEAAPPTATRIKLRLFWLAREPLRPGARLTLRLATAEHTVTVERIDHVVEVHTLETRTAELVRRNETAEIEVVGRTAIAFDRHADLPGTGRGVLIDGYDVVGGVTILDATVDSRLLFPTERRVDAQARRLANGHSGGVVWLTGLSGSGKSTLATALELRLFARGWQTTVLDGDSLRTGLGRDLGFSTEDRAENVRRAAEVARLFAEAGLIAIVALISPERWHRALAGDVVGDGFREIFVKADLAICEQRDPKGLYAKARRGEIQSFTGVSAPYEAPETPDLAIDTGTMPIDAAIDLLESFTITSFAGSAKRVAEGVDPSI
jgi:bifunctional enzyme CysN/CysC